MDTNECFNQFVEDFQDIVDKAFPLITSRNKTCSPRKNDKKWLTEEPYNNTLLRKLDSEVKSKAKQRYKICKKKHIMRICSSNMILRMLWTQSSKEMLILMLQKISYYQCCDERKNIRELALRHGLGERTECDARVRKIKVPSIKFDANDYIDIISWAAEKTNEAQPDSYVDLHIDFSRLPYHI
ncbi:hypothetical protein HHI36_001547 [Cryptolaemus montrouzieri]|uniref:Uncharacterized protein n=1 Tax=Cryptolaemus montrouzieri TaxID=559131 RepID=A0ABD2P7T7_9CUCU